jgi:Tfp pilus assembly protein PilF
MIRHSLCFGLAGLIVFGAVPRVSHANLPSVIQQHSPVNLEQAAVYNTQGFNLALQGRFREAIIIFEQAIAEYPHYDIAYNNLGISYAQLGNFSEAVTAFEQALALNPQNVEYYNNLGSALGSLGRIKEAATIFEAAIARYPNEPDSHFNLALAFLTKNQRDEAVACLMTARNLYQSRQDWASVQQINQMLEDLAPNREP